MMLKKFILFCFLSGLIVLVSCTKKQTAAEILERTIISIDTIESVYYKQDMWRTNPRKLNDTLFRFREMYFKRLLTDSIVGVKGHWYMYLEDKQNAAYEDIYDGKRLLRINNRDRIARVYDLEKYPDWKRKHFWSHNTPYGMQYEFKYMLKNTDSYAIERLNDTIIGATDCYQIVVLLEDKETMPGFATDLEESEGSISKTLYFIDKDTFYPIGMKSEFYSRDNQRQKIFIDQRYYAFRFNLNVDENTLLNTSTEAITGIEQIEMKPE